MANDGMTGGVFVGFILGIGVVYLAHALGNAFPDPNAVPTYGKTGLPKNCRAIITANMDSYRLGSFGAAEALEAIDRNCGASGYSWGR